MEEQERQETALTQVGSHDVSPIASDALIVLAEQAEKRVKAMNSIKRMALALTNANDWVDEGGKPYLQASGGEKVARMFGISWRMGEPVKENLEAGHYMYTYEGEFTLAGATVTAVGVRSSKDGFFKVYRWEGPEENRKRIELPASEIDVGNVKKAAYTNCIANGITRLLGLRNLTWDDLKQHAGITKDQVTSVEYGKKGGSKGAAAKPAQAASKPTASKPAEAKEEAPAEGGERMATEPQQRAIHAILGQLGVGGELEKHQAVAKILGMKAAPTSMGKLTMAEASKVIQTLNEQLGSQEGGDE